MPLGPSMLTVKRPSPTTVLYTVSTRSSNQQSLTARLRRVALGLSRILVGFFLALLVVVKAQDYLALRYNSPRTDFPLSLLPESIGHVYTTVAYGVPWTYLVPVSLAIFPFIIRKGYTSESLLVIRGLGIQTSTSSPTYLNTATTRFIPTNMIQDMYIYEAFKGFEVRFYLAVVVEGEHDVVVVFPNILPRRQVLEEVWRGARSCLYEPKS